MYLDEGDNKSAEDEINRLIIGKFCPIATGVKFMMGRTYRHNYELIASYPLDFWMMTSMMTLMVIRKFRLKPIV